MVFATLFSVPFCLSETCPNNKEFPGQNGLSTFSETWVTSPSGSFSLCWEVPFTVWWPDTQQTSSEFIGRDLQPEEFVILNVPPFE